jgi:FAD/FMN-containing dehydrogenase
VTDDHIRSLAGRMAGTLVTPNDREYDTARAVWNAMIDRTPGLIARCINADDVMHGVAFAREHRLRVAVRGGGHNIAGNAVCDGGLVLDLSPMKSIEVDPAKRTARAAPGVLLGEFDNATQAHGLATPLGINSTTGIAGLTLGGGFGWLSRTYGLTIDNLIGADVVTADGRRLRASATSNPDLFWGVRGGGGNFGVVTSFEYRLHPVGPEVLAGLVVHPFADAKALLREYRRLTATAPDELTVWVVTRKAPPLPFLPAEYHGKEVLVLAMCYSGNVAEGEKAAKPFRAIGTPIADVVGPMPFVGWQTAFDPLLTPGVRNYWKSHNFPDLPDGAIDAVLKYAGELPSPHSEIFIGQMGGATSRVAPDATAYEHRDAAFVLNVHTRWETKEEDQRCIAWAREIFNATRPFATGGVYVNFMPEDETNRIESAYGKNFKRLIELKRKYDPENLFRMNQNIRPDA